MKIVILGAGKVGQSIVENFFDDESDLVVIDENQENLDAISSKHDLLTIQGSCTDLETLEHADLKSANLLIAVTDDDESNIIACKIANDLYNVQVKIARLRKKQYLENQDKLFGEDSDIFPIDYIIEPTKIMANSLYNLIMNPGVETFNYFGEEQNCALITIKAQYGGIKVGKSFVEARNELLNVRNNVSLVGIIRNGVILPKPESIIISANDEVILFGRIENLKKAMALFQRPIKVPKKIMLAGGSKINYYLAEMLSLEASVKIIESNSSRANHLSNDIPNCLILEGDCTDETLLFEERIDKTDLFIAATDQDNVNVLTGVLAKRLGSKRVISLLGRSSNLSLIHNKEIDIIYSGRHDIATELRSKAHITNFEKIYKHPNGTFIFAEFDLIKNLKPVPNMTLGMLKYPGVQIIGTINDDDEFKVYNENQVITEQDHALIMCTDSKTLSSFTKSNFKTAEFV